ncbi:MAG: hydroxypyruvate isomerase [Armatimonadetes bacterium CG_4_10_14_3_um_filter_66_18]|nr:TIM barrel protein [Armatimonadota bacterium]OIO96727.1 MAG: hypothetical protein AUJ96_24375 [Armatimonadetes bacterium CG2_30_66_41]PIX43586.1 MAG: hydroxypyruvate isomerase [Armatimonadetes bacterium CG_4_8_14_3_um_filter_66_20]PIY49624.1 MAG: hydroxypyruvate isomerase [Armatimonadetes bacterium CG_4_10_14_3_um_filter_66_18]PIZ31710.1 MAG: hydroxypyruvate isomerase [Armatimonadetes bacterium CG_4_10_14_0_8_um_filter_66_14]PJB60120.1 MAG: hydroxypyruvate isomerase [Armatimonadetes bacteri
MLKISSCIEMILGDLAHHERIRAAAPTGIDAVEFWGWQGKDLDAVEAALKDTGLPLAAFGCGGGSLVEAGNRDNFVAAVKESLAVSQQLDCWTMIVTTGQELPDVSREAQHAAVVDALKAAAPLAEDNGVTLVLEPLNVLVDHKGYFLVTSDEGLQIVEEVGSANVKLLYDIYHQQISEGNLIPTIQNQWQKIGHFHAADHPGRFEPGTGEINYLNVFAAIHRQGYDKYVGMEYRPTKDALETLRDIVALGKQAKAL